MAEILVKAIDTTNSDPDQDRRCYKRGMPVVVMPDGHSWGTQEGLPKFVVLKIPGVPVDRVLKYIEPQYEVFPVVDPVEYRRRLWQLRWADLPNPVRNRLQNNGQLIIKAGTYSGSYDYTWQQVKTFLRNLFTGQDETEDL